DQVALHERLLKEVAELKFVEPTPVQAAAIPPALEGRDLRVTAQTGSGKTAAFVLPMLNRLIGDAVVRTDVRALILLPTRELAQQPLKEVDRFSQLTFIKSAIITGGEDFKVQVAIMRKVPDILIGTAGICPGGEDVMVEAAIVVKVRDILIVTTGRMIERLVAVYMILQDVELLILDEADRMLGMCFRDDVQCRVSECDKRQQTLLSS